MEKLNDSLVNLHQVLQNTGDIDEESVKILEEIMSDIKGILDRNEAIPLKGQHKILGSLQESAGKFELTHPALSGAINIVISALTNIGI